MQTAVLTLQSKGQIMIPKDWREDFGVTVYQAIKDDDVIILTPIATASNKEVLRAAAKAMKKNHALLKSLANK